MITTSTRTVTSAPAQSGRRITRPSEATRSLIAGVVLLVIAASSLFSAVTSWTQVDTSDSLGFHYVQAILAAVGAALVVGGIVKSRKQH